MSSNIEYVEAEYNETNTNLKELIDIGMREDGSYNVSIVFPKGRVEEILTLNRDLKENQTFDKNHSLFITAFYNLVDYYLRESDVIAPVLLLYMNHFQEVFNKLSRNLTLDVMKDLDQKVGELRKQRDELINKYTN